MRTYLAYMRARARIFAKMNLLQKFGAFVRGSGLFLLGGAATAALWSTSVILAVTVGLFVWMALDLLAHRHGLIGGFVSGFGAGHACHTLAVLVAVLFLPVSLVLAQVVYFVIFVSTITGYFTTILDQMVFDRVADVLTLDILEEQALERASRECYAEIDGKRIPCTVVQS